MIGLIFIFRRIGISEYLNSVLVPRRILALTYVADNIGFIPVIDEVEENLLDMSLMRDVEHSKRGKFITKRC